MAKTRGTRLRQVFPIRTHPAERTHPAAQTRRPAPFLQTGRQMGRNDPAL